MKWRRFRGLSVCAAFLLVTTAAAEAPALKLGRWIEEETQLYFGKDTQPGGLNSELILELSLPFEFSAPKPQEGEAKSRLKLSASELRARLDEVMARYREFGVFHDEHLKMGTPPLVSIPKMTMDFLGSQRATLDRGLDLQVERRMIYCKPGGRCPVPTGYWLSWSGGACSVKGSLEDDSKQNRLVLSCRTKTYALARKHFDFPKRLAKARASIDGASIGMDLDFSGDAYIRAQLNHADILKSKIMLLNLAGFEYGTYDNSGHQYWQSLGSDQQSQFFGRFLLGTYNFRGLNAIADPNGDYSGKDVVRRGNFRVEKVQFPVEMRFFFDCAQLPGVRVCQPR
jgi:hypothetical protein